MTDPQTTLLFLTDSHAGATAEGFQQQPRRVDLLRPIFDGIRNLIDVHAVDLLVHGGDLTHNGTEPEIVQALDLLASLGAPAAICLGNHDLATRQSLDLWRAMTGRSGACRLADTTIALPGLDVVLLNTAWSAGEQPQACFHWDPQFGCNEGLLVEQLRWLEEQLARGNPDRPAVLMTHAPLDALPPDLTGAAEPIHLVKEDYARALNAVLDRHPRVKLVFTGHNHVTCATRHGGRVHVSTSAVVEAPFELRLLRVGRRSLEVLTLAALPEGPDILYHRELAWVNGRPGDRIIRLDWT